MPDALHLRTGHWGSGDALHGDPALRAAIQWIAATRAGRPLDYCPTDPDGFRSRQVRALIAAVRDQVRDKTVGGLLRYLFQDRGMIHWSRDVALPDDTFGADSCLIA